MLTLLLLLLSIFIDLHAQHSPLFRTFEYKHSFRRPHLALHDGSIPFWIVQGDAIASPEQLRLAPSMRSRKGLAWNKRPMMSENFEVEVEFKVMGQGRIGADGMAVWYTKNIGSPGVVYGANDYWTGLAVFLDSYDNDAKQNNPFISVMINDGTRSYDHQSDGSNQIVGGCTRDFRNQKYPVRLRIEYVHNVLTISTTNGVSAERNYEICVRSENVFLPRNGYFGMSAATGGLADDHDVLEFSTTSLSAETSTRSPIPQDEQQKYGDQFAKQQQEYEQERMKFKEQHPEKVKDEEDDPSKYYEDATTRELRFINENQLSIYRTMQQLDHKLLELTQKQQSYINIMSEIQRNINGNQQIQQPGGQVPRSTDYDFLPHEKLEVLQSLRDLTTAVKEMRSYVNEIFTRSYNIEQKISGQATHQQIASQQDPQSQEMRIQLESIKNELAQIRNSQQHQTTNKCSDFSCITSTVFITIVVLQSAAIMAFIFFRFEHIVSRN